MFVKKIKKYFSYKNFVAKQAGFTLIETFIAITILLIAMTGPLYLVTKSLSASKLAKDQTTAIYLAQEAVEYIRNIRDSNILNNDNWLTDLSACLDAKCVINSPDDRNVVACSGGECVPLNYDPLSKLYRYDEGAESRFRREIQINTLSSGKEVEIVVTLSWPSGPTEKIFTVREHLFNWQ